MIKFLLFSVFFVNTYHFISILGNNIPLSKHSVQILNQLPLEKLEDATFFRYSCIIVLKDR